MHPALRFARLRFSHQVTNRLANEIEGTAPDGKSIRIALKPSSGDYEADVIEFEGIVDGPAALRETGHTNLNAAFDMANYNELCKMVVSPDCREVFMSV